MFLYGYKYSAAGFAKYRIFLCCNARGAVCALSLLAGLICVFNAAPARAEIAQHSSAERTAGNTAAAAVEPPSCSVVYLAEPGWTDIMATTAVAAEVLQALGYEAQTKFLSVPVIFSAMATGEIDVFLGFWQPTMAADIKPYLQSRDVEIVRDNLQGARYGLAVPRRLAEAGLSGIADIARFAPALDYKIYGVEPGNDANRILLTMIDKNSDALGQFQLVESSEQAMLAEVEAAEADKKPIVFLAWEPHPMNGKIALTYLSGGDAWFGSGGGARVATVARKNYGSQCPNINRFLHNLVFTLAQENGLMDKILAQNIAAEDAARAFLRENPEVLTVWLQGVRTRSGEDALTVIDSMVSGGAGVSGKTAGYAP